MTYVIYGAHAVIGFGLWKLRNWARRAALVLAILGCAIGIIFVPFSVRSGPLVFVTAANWAVPFMWVVWYLERPRIRFAFDAWPSIQSEGLTAEPPPRLSKVGKICVYMALAASLALFVYAIQIA
jgi:hypothetical protein